MAIELTLSQRLDYDSPWKMILDNYFQSFLELCHPEAAKNINWNKGYESLDKELNSITKKSEMKKRIADKLIKVWLHDGIETWVLLHIEIQNQQEKDFAKRMYIYNYRLFDRYDKCIVSLAILTDNKLNWRPSFYRQELWGCATRFDFVPIKLLEYEKEQEKLLNSTNPFSIVILTHLAAIKTKKDKQQRFLSKLTLTRSLYEKGWDKTAIVNLYTFIDWVIALPKPLEIEYIQEIEQFEQEKHMIYITSAERIGIEKGIQQGLQQGEKAVLYRQLARKFGHIPLDYQQRVEQARSEELLEWADKIIFADSVEEVFG